MDYGCLDLHGLRSNGFFAPYRMMPTLPVQVQMIAVHASRVAGLALPQVPQNKLGFLGLIIVKLVATGSLVTTVWEQTLHNNASTRTLKSRIASIRHFHRCPPIRSILMSRPLQPLQTSTETLACPPVPSTSHLR